MADANILEERALEIEFDTADAVRILVATRLEGDPVDAFQAFQIAEGNRCRGCKIDLAGFDRDRAGRRVRDEADDQLVEIGTRLIPVFRIALVDEMAAANPFLEFEGTGADRREVGRVFRDLRSLIDMASRISIIYPAVRTVASRITTLLLTPANRASVSHWLGRPYRMQQWRPAAWCGFATVRRTINGACAATS
ncbi:hypothetical protein FHX15_004965 [Rhizobium sp. BK650]|nr:hypothetical protein [Rhizobium sp. BK650]